jgi:hypothetical protein
MRQEGSHSQKVKVLRLPAQIVFSWLRYILALSSFDWFYCWNPESDNGILRRMALGFLLQVPYVPVPPSDEDFQLIGRFSSDDILDTI